MNNRRSFLKEIGLFSILAGAGRVWKAERVLHVEELISPYNKFPWYVAETQMLQARQFYFLPTYQDFLRTRKWPENMADTVRVIERTTIKPIPPQLFTQTRKPLTADDLLR